MKHFYICDYYHGTPCIFTEQTMRPLWKKTGGDIARCIRHGALITNERDAESKKELHAQIKREDEDREGYIARARSRYV
jgi:hypothetical protein